MAIECFEIKWTGPFTLESIQNKSEARAKGIYAIYKGREIYYIGKSINFGTRLKTHMRNWTHIGKAQVKSLRVRVGIIVRYKGTHPSQDITSDQLSNIESFLINEEKPKGNPDSDKKGYKGRISPIIINTGNMGSFEKTYFHNQSLEKLLRASLKPKRREPVY
jgi:hypothetical protein